MPIRTIPERSNATDEFVGRLERQYAALQLGEPPVVDELRSRPARPELLLFFGERHWQGNADLEGQLETYAKGVEQLLPVLNEAQEATTHLPKAIQRFNAFLRKPHEQHWSDALVDEVLTLVWQRRAKRKIFISYRRVDAEGVAHQLHLRYVQLGFDVFLDDVSVGRGVDFQIEIGRRLEDADAVLLLISPEISSSEWVRQEITLALTHRVGLLGIVWPKERFPDGKLPAAALQVPEDRQLRLRTASLDGKDVPSQQALAQDHLAEVDHLLFTGRSQAIASRLRDLVVRTKTRLEGEGYAITSVSPDGDLALMHRGQAWTARVVPFRPQIAELWRWQRELRQTGTAGLIVIYPELDADVEQAVALREICQIWGMASAPQVRLLEVRV